MTTVTVITQNNGKEVAVLGTSDEAYSIIDHAKSNGLAFAKLTGSRGSVYIDPRSVQTIAT